MAVTFDAVGPGTSGQSAIDTTPVTWTHVCGASATLLTVEVAIGAYTDSGIALSVTYNGVSLTSAGLVHVDNTTAGFTQIFYLINPAIGSNTVSITITGLTASTTLNAGSLSFNNASGIRNFVTAFGNSTAPSVAVTSAVGNMVVDSVATGTGVTSSSQTLRWLHNTNTATGGGNGAASTATGATTVTMSYVVGTDYWAIAAMDVVSSVSPNMAGTSHGLATASASLVAASFSGPHSVNLNWNANPAGDDVIYYNIKRAPSVVTAFSDTFNEGTLNATNWAPTNATYTNYTGGGSNVTFAPANCSLAAGSMQLTLTQPTATTSTGAEIVNTTRFGYGTYAWSLRAASSSTTSAGAGTTYPGQISTGFIYYNGISEIDCPEIEGRTPNVAEFTNWLNGVNTGAASVTVGFNPQDGFHVYGFVWSATSIIYSIDGVVVATHTTDIPTQNAYPIISCYGTNSSTWGGLATVGTTRYLYCNNFSYESLTPGTFAQLATSTTNSYVDSSGLVEGLTYWYEITAVNSVGESSASLPASALIPFTRTLSSAGQATSTLTFANTQGLITGMSSGVAVDSVTMTGSASFSGTAAGQATASLAVSGVQTGFAGNSAGVAVATVSMTGSSSFAGISHGVAVDSVVVGGSTSIAGTSAGVATATLMAAAVGLLLGESSGVATATAPLIGTGNVSGASSGVALTSVNISAGGSAQSHGVATGSVNLTASGAIAAISHGVAVGSVVVSGGLTSISMTSAGQATAHLVLLGLTAMSGTSGGVGTANANLTGLFTALGESDGVATASVILTGTGKIVASSSGVALATAAFAGSFGGSNGVATGSVTLTALGGAMALSNGVAIDSVTVGGLTSLGGLSAGQATAVIRVVSAILGLSAGSGAATATLLGSGTVASVSFGVAQDFASLTASVGGTGITPKFISGQIVNTVYAFAPQSPNTLDINASGFWTLTANVPWITFSQLSGTSGATAVTIEPYKLESYLPMATNGVPRVREGSYGFNAILNAPDGVPRYLPLVLVIGYGDTVGTGPQVTQ